MALWLLSIVVCVLAGFVVWLLLRPAKFHVDVESSTYVLPFAPQTGATVEWLTRGNFTVSPVFQKGWPCTLKVSGDSSTTSCYVPPTGGNSAFYYYTVAPTAQANIRSSSVSFQTLAVDGCKNCNGIAMLAGVGRQGVSVAPPASPDAIYGCPAVGSSASAATPSPVSPKSGSDTVYWSFSGTITSGTPQVLYPDPGVCDRGSDLSYPYPTCKVLTSGNYHLATVPGCTEPSPTYQISK